MGATQSTNTYPVGVSGEPAAAGNAAEETTHTFFIANTCLNALGREVRDAFVSHLSPERRAHFESCVPRAYVQCRSKESSKIVAALVRHWLRFGIRDTNHVSEIAVVTAAESATRADVVGIVDIYVKRDRGDGMSIAAFPIEIKLGTLPIDDPYAKGTLIHLKADDGDGDDVSTPPKTPPTHVIDVAALPTCRLGEIQLYCADA